MNGYALSGIVNGLSNGIQLGQQIRGALDQAEVRNVMSEGMDQAKQARTDDITANSQVGSKANAENTMTMPTFDDTRGNSYANADDQKKAAEKNAPLADDFYIRDIVPKIKETYIAQGNQAGADAWDKWAQDKNTQTGMKYWAQALRAGQMGDFKTYADTMVKAYNTPGYYDDGLHAEGYDLVKDKDGNTTGLTLKMKNNDTGESFSQTIHGQADMVQAGIGLLDPRNAFQTTAARVAAQEAAGAKVAAEDRKFQNNIVRDDRKTVNKAAADSKLEDQRAGNALTKQAEGKRLDAENANKAVAGKVQMLKSAGYDEGFIKAALPQILGIGQYKKPADPQEVRRMLHQARLSDFNYTRKTQQQQAEQIEQDMQLINGGQQAPQQQPANPMAAGLPGGQAGGGGTPMIYDTKTGQMLPYQ